MSDPVRKAKTKKTMPDAPKLVRKQTGRKRKRHLRKSIAIGLCTVLACGGVLSMWKVFQKKPADAKNSQQAAAPGNTGGSSSNQTANRKSFSFAGVGDNLLHEPIYYYWDTDHDNRDYAPIYQGITPVISAADLGYINQETVCAGDAFGLSTYPSFNGPSEFLDTLAASGFDWLSASSNHSMDAGTEALLYELDYLKQRYPGISVTGAHSSQEEANTPIVREINGIKVGLAGFTYGLNGYSKPEGYDWLVDVYDDGNGNINYALIDQILDRLNAASDVQLVAMHWGVEYTNDPTPVQRELAQHLHEKGVEAIIGTHPHVIQPAEFIKDDNQETLVFYSLGNLLSAQDTNATMVGGLAQFVLNYDFNTKKASFENVTFTPTITLISPDLHTFGVALLPDYTDEMAANQFVTVVSGEDCSVQWVKDYTASVMGAPEGIEIIYGS